MANERILSITAPYDQWLPSNWSPTGERLSTSHPLPLQLIEADTLEVTINITAWCAGLTPPPSPVIRFRLGGTALHANTSPAFVDEATHGELLAEFDVSDAYTAGDFYNAPAPTFNQEGALRYSETVTVANPGELTYLRISVVQDASDRGCGMVACRIDVRGI